MNRLSAATKAIGFWGFARIAIGWTLCLAVITGWCVLIDLVVVDRLGAPIWIWAILGPSTVFIAAASLWAVIDRELDRPGGYRDIYIQTLREGLEAMQQDRYNREAVRSLLESVPGVEPGKSTND